MDSIVSVDRVSKRFGSLVAVDGLQLDVRQGEFLTLLGPSGCGKTTTLRLISGFETPDEGEIRIDGQRVNDVPPYRRCVNTVFQNYALFPHLTVFDNVAYSLAVRRLERGVISNKVHSMLERVGLPDKTLAMPHQLSGGQMQRVALARALVSEPRVLLLDEPLSSLDAKLRRSMQIELKHIQRSLGLSFIYVTHDQEEALILSDRVAVINEGKVAQLGTPQSVFERPESLFVAEFVGTSNFISGSVSSIQGNMAHVIGPNGVQWRATISDQEVRKGPITIIVRPQRFAVLAEQEQSTHYPNKVETAFEELIYVGSTIRLVLRLLDGSSILVEVSPDHMPFDYRLLKAGDRVTIGCAEDAPILFPAH